MAIIHSKARRDMIEASGRLFQLLGLPRSTGQIYGLVYLSMKPCSLDDVVDLLGISKASASTGTRQLAAWGALRQVWVPGERRDYFEAVGDLGALVRGGYSEFVKPRLASSQKRLANMMGYLDSDAKEGFLTPEECRFCAERLKNLSRMQKKIQALAPLAEKLF
ncbi:MAG: hypothetical protein AAB466_11905 [Verrucomicrobiota bacterium]